MKTRLQAQPRRRGVVLVFTVLTIIVLLGFAGFAIDGGLIYLVRTELQRTADAAALAAVTQLDVRLEEQIVHAAMAEEAVRYAALNHVLGEGIILDPATDFEAGRYLRNSRTFTPGGVPTNAVRVTARRTEASANGPIPLYFMSLFGHPTAEVQADAMVLFDYECYSRGIRALDVQIAAGAQIDGMCIYGRERVQIAAGASTTSTAYVASQYVEDVNFGGEVPPGFVIDEYDYEPMTLNEVENIISAIGARSAVAEGVDVVVLDARTLNHEFDLNDFLPGTAYVVYGDVQLVGGAVSLENVTLAVQGKVTFGPDTILHNGALPSEGGEALTVLATDDIRFAVGAGITNAKLITGRNLSVASGAEVVGGSIEAAGRVTIAARARALHDAFAIRYGDTRGAAVLVE